MRTKYGVFSTTLKALVLGASYEELMAGTECFVLLGANGRRNPEVTHVDECLVNAFTWKAG